jgi:L-arabinose isomerase
MDDHAPIIGILHAGHPRYWTQFPGSREQTIAGAERLAALVRGHGAQVVLTDLCDTTEKAHVAGRQLEAAHLDLVIVYLHSYVASGYWVPALMHLAVPTVLICLPKSFDFETEYITGTAVRQGSPCQLPEAHSALVRVGKRPLDLVVGDPDLDPRPLREIGEWCRVATALRAFRHTTFGYLGHSYDGMLDMNFDPTAVTRDFGVYVKMLEMCQLQALVEAVTPAEVDAKQAEMRQHFDFLAASGDPLTRAATDEEIAWSARCAVGLDRLVADHHLSGLAYYYEGLDNAYERLACSLIVGNTLLTSRGVPLAGEADMKTCLAMRATAALGAGGSFAELSIVDFQRNEVYVGHDGPHDMRITEGRPVVRGLDLFHGKRGRGVSVEFGIRKGPITLVSVASDAEGRFGFVVSEGQSMPGRLPKIANTVTRARMGDDVAAWIRAWSMSGVPHHMSLCVGHIAPLVRKLGAAMRLPVTEI